MLSTNAFFFSRSANSRLDVKFPVTENACCSAPGFGVCGDCQGSSPQIPSGPVYGDCDVPLVPKKRSVTSHQPLANCVELNVKLQCNLQLSRRRRFHVQLHAVS